MSRTSHLDLSKDDNCRCRLNNSACRTCNNDCKTTGKFASRMKKRMETQEAAAATEKSENMQKILKPTSGTSKVKNKSWWKTQGCCPCGGYCVKKCDCRDRTVVPLVIIAV